MSQAGQSDRHLSRTQIEALASVEAEIHWFGIDGNQERTLRSLARRGLVERKRGGKTFWAITSTGRARLRRCR